MASQIEGLIFFFFNAFISAGAQVLVAECGDLLYRKHGV